MNTSFTGPTVFVKRTWIRRYQLALPDPRRSSAASAQVPQLRFLRRPKAIYSAISCFPSPLHLKVQQASSRALGDSYATRGLHDQPDCLAIVVLCRGMRLVGHAVDEPALVLAL